MSEDRQSEINQLRKMVGGSASGDRSSKGSDSFLAFACLFGAFGLLVLASMFATNNPIDFILQVLGTIVGYVLLGGIVVNLATIEIYYYNLSVDDPEKSISERAQDNLEISREKSNEISASIRRFYEDYKVRKRLAELELEAEQAKQDKEDTAK